MQIHFQGIGKGSQEFRPDDFWFSVRIREKVIHDQDSELAQWNRAE